MVRRAYANGDIYVGTYEGWYCPNEGFRSAADVQRDGPRDDLPEPSRRPAPVAERAELVLPAVGLPGAARASLRRPPGLPPARGAAQRDARLHPPGARGLLDQPAGRRLGDPVPDRGERRDRPARGRQLGSRGRHDLRLVRRAHQLHHRGRLPGRPRGVRPLVAGRPPHHRQGHRPVPHRLLAGDALERRARGAEAGLGPRLAVRGRRRADEQEPGQLPRADRHGGRVRRRRRPLRRPPRGPVRPRRGGLLGLVRPALQRRSGQRLRQPRQPDGLDGRTATSTASDRPRAERSASALGDAWAALLPEYRDRLERCLFHEALAILWDFVGGANKTVDAEQPWVLAKAAKAGDAAAAARLAVVLGDLIEACRLVGLAAAPFLPGTAPRVLAQLGHAYPYGADGNGGPALLDELRWGAHAGDEGRLEAPEPLFPRLDSEVAEPDEPAVPPAS